MNRQSWMARALTLMVAGAALAGCAVYPAGPYGYRGDHGYGRSHAHAEGPGWRGRAWAGDRYAGDRYAGGWGRRDGWR